MRWGPIALLLLTPVASAQTAVPADQITRVLHDFEARTGDTPLRCEVTPLPPILNFALRFQAGYTFHVPQSQYPGAIRGWTALTTITPEGGNRQPTILLARHRFSDAAKSDLNFDIHGTYFLGVGRYSVESALRDDRNRICRTRWLVTVKPSRPDRAAQSALPPNTVRQVSAPASSDAQQPDRIPPIRLSLLLNAAAFSPRRTGIGAAERGMLLGALTSLLEHLPTISVRMVVFSLEQQREVFRSDDFGLPELTKVADSIAALQLRTVDVHILERPLGHVDFLAALINREIRAPVPAGTVIFLGPTSRYGNKLPAGAIQSPAGAQPHFFYVRYEGSRRRPIPSNIAGIPSADIALPGGRSNGSGTTSPDSSSSTDPTSPPTPRPGGNGPNGGPSTGASGGNGGGTGRGGGRSGGSGLPPMPPAIDQQSDMIAEAVASLRGKTLNIHSPAELAKAIRKIEGKR